MANPELTFDEQSPPSDDLRVVAQSVFNLFPMWDLRVFGEIDSTNAEARRITLMLGGDAYPRVVLADHQSQGRGRRGRSWIAPPRSSLLATFMAPVARLAYPTSLLPIYMGCWLIEGLESFGVDNIEVKWPNDVLVDGKKIAGILCETSAAAMLAGVGVNLTQQDGELPEPPQGRPAATSLALALQENFPGRTSATLGLLGAFLENLEHPAREDWILQRYKSRCATLGQSVTFRDPRDGTLNGVAKDIDATGALVVEVAGMGRKIITQTLESE